MKNSRTKRTHKVNVPKIVAQKIMPPPYLCPERVNDFETPGVMRLASERFD